MSRKQLEKDKEGTLDHINPSTKWARKYCTIAAHYAFEPKKPQFLVNSV